jgi:sterol desaturase/sphingolipid hydroxylase (fatty acid hydroxylase superfamily)
MNMEQRIRPGDQPIRLFKSDFLEMFSHISPVTVLVIWVPVSLFFLVEAVLNRSGDGFPFYIALALVAGWVVWTFTEYIMHRFIFHYHPKTEQLKKFFFTVHGVHHAQPMCKTRLVMPPVMSIPLSVLFFALFYLVVARLFAAPAWFYPVFAGFLIGYIIYDMMHYTLHHSKSRNAYVQMCRYQHMQHHGNCPNMRFGVTFPFWDHIFHTMPERTTPHTAGNKD